MERDQSLSEYLALICRDIAGNPLPGNVTEKAKMCLLDFLAALHYGARSPMGVVKRNMLATMGSGHATLVANRTTSSSYGAAFFHGLIATADDLDDSHRFATGIHLSAVTIPAALALAEERGASGETLLRAIVSGYEIAGRLTRAVDSGLRARGFHSTGAVGPLAASAASSLILGFDEHKTANAFGIAASSAGGLFAFLSEGASVRHSHGAWASANGLAAAMMADAGMTGPRNVLEGKDGYLSAYTSGHDQDFILSPSPVTSGTYEITSAYHKIYACCGHAFPSIAATLALRPEINEQFDDIRSITANVYKASAALTNPRPQSVDEAKFSLPAILGMALVFGAPGYRVMSMENVRDPRVQALAKKVEVREDATIASAFPRLRAAEVVITMNDGREIRHFVDAAPGMPENPIDWTALEAKFRDAATGLVSTDNIAAIIDRVHTIENANSVTELMRLLQNNLNTSPQIADER